MDEQEFQYRKFDPVTKKFQSDSPGRVIRSPRKFGIELEMFNERSSMLGKLGGTISKAFGLEHDGSIQSGGNSSLEVVSPVMSGSLGEEAVRDLFKHINEFGFKVNKSCGLHVHLDGSDFLDDSNADVFPVSTLTKQYLDETFTGAERVFVVKGTAMRKIISATALEPDDIAEMVANSENANLISIANITGLKAPELERTDGVVEIEGAMLFVDVYDTPKPKEEISGEEHIINMSEGSIVAAPDDYYCSYKTTKNLDNILTLLYMHTVYSDVFRAMLPPSRRSGNSFCQDLSIAFSPKQIEQITSYQELEAAWYKTKTIHDTNAHKSNKYDDSRYFSLNLHSLFAKYGTVEYRAHSATLDPERVLYWIALHQTIMDKIVSGEITIDALRSGANLYGVAEKLPVLLKILRLRTGLRKYVQKRIDFFNNSNPK